MRGEALITFEEEKVAALILKMAKYTVSCDKNKVYVKTKSLTLDPSVKFETFCGTPKRTILLNHIEDIQDEEDVQDYLEIHFQKPSNYDGEVEYIKYISRGKEVKAFFTEDAAEMEP